MVTKSHASKLLIYCREAWWGADEELSERQVLTAQVPALLLSCLHLACFYAADLYHCLDLLNQRGVACIMPGRPGTRL